MDAVQAANSGHPGMPMGMADAAVVLWKSFLKHDPLAPSWPDRDRFVLSAGHGSMLLYALLHLSGYDLPLSEIRAFRQWGSKTPGHPERGLTPGVETTTGPLGQGISNAVGLALAERHLAARFNRPGFAVVDHFTYVVASDGDLMEGISHESCALAGHLGLGKLIVLYDDNRITIDGPTSLAFSEDVVARFAAYGWHAKRIDGHDPDAVEGALQEAKNETSRPSLIACRTHIGFGSPHRQDSAKAHGEALGAEEVRLTKVAYGWSPDESFVVPPEVQRFMDAREAGERSRRAWEASFAEYGKAHPDLARALGGALKGDLPEGWDSALPSFASEKPLATRAASGAFLEAVASRIPALIGGSADLTPSNNTFPKGEEELGREAPQGRYIHFGVREHAMASMMNGLALHGGLRPYGGTFLVFSDYMRPAIRLAALMELPVTFVFTHDSIGLGEDGPTHQPIEHLASLRAIPHVVVYRPADATETLEGWKVALERTSGPTLLVLTRQALPVLDRTRLAPAEEARKGGYLLSPAKGARALILATGSEVAIALEAQGLLSTAGVPVSVVSLPSFELFEKQPEEYRESVLPRALKARVAIEAASPFGWDRYVGPEGRVVGLRRFGASAPYKDVYRHLGLTAEKVVEEVRSLLGA